MSLETIDSAWTEPVVVDPSNPPQYPYNKIQQSESGHSIEMDDTVFGDWSAEKRLGRLEFRVRTCERQVQVRRR
jgi:hypothetical protein